ncbi:cytochrome P450 [Aspergillus alliaceus]|uniref:Cytochrome P450 n=1 Tax=Petromyces alliaceus TaxID=209559 RepID=A0A5N7CPT0_PETAA|nr:cytochrome P450 [Aspergillus alliaceus]
MPVVVLSWAGAVVAVTVLILRVWRNWPQRLDNPTDAVQSFPYSVPFIKSTIPFMFNGPSFFHHASRYCKGNWPLRVNLINDEVYLVQGAKNIASIFTSPKLTVTRAYAIALKSCFGMEQKAVDVYLTDTSGSSYRPIPGSQIPLNQRVCYRTHENLVQGLLGPGLGPTTERIEAALFASLDRAVPKSSEWVCGTDLSEFFEDHLGSAILQSLYGSLLISKNADFNRNLWRYDKQIMTMAKRLPSWLTPEAYSLRDELLLSIMRWHQEATFLSETMTISEQASEGGADPYWGSAMMRERHKMLLSIEGQDLKSVASTDLGLIWATVTNVVPSAMTLCTHMYRDRSLAQDIRYTVQDCIRPATTLRFDIEKLGHQPLLLSMYAEALRFGVQIHIPRCSPHQPLSMGGASIQPNKLILINTALAHTDESAWNTRSGEYPLDTFWARRFLIDPTDPNTGPLKHHSEAFDSTKTNNTEKTKTSNPSTFSLKGLDGVWIPYGGGQHACPGRLLAKRIMLVASAMMVTMFDVELLAPDTLQFGSPRFGFGVRKPSEQVPFRIRRRH